jgi:hypothetical protein
MIKFKTITIITVIVGTLFSFTLVATIPTEASTQSDTTSQSGEGSVSYANEWYVPLAPVAIAGVAAIIGVLTYWYNRKKERLTQIIMPILKEYNELDEAEIAIKILDDYPHKFKETYDPQAYRLYNNGEISKTDLPLVLRDDRWVNTSRVEDDVIESFDALLYFFAELEYVLQVGIVKKTDLALFVYEIKKVAQEPAIRNFVNMHELSFFQGNLDKKLKMEKGNYSNIVCGNEEEQLKKLKNAGYAPAN